MTSFTVTLCSLSSSTMTSSYSHRRSNLIAKPWCEPASRSQNFCIKPAIVTSLSGTDFFFAFQPQRIVLPQNSFQPPGKSTHFTFNEPSRHSGTVEGLNYNSVNTHIIKVGLLPIFRLFVLIVLHRPLNHRAALAFGHINRKVGVFLALRAQQEHRVR